jgi:hypothetical protein
MNKIRSECRKRCLGLGIVVWFVSSLHAATLKESIYLDIEWGQSSGQVGHWAPGKGQDDEGEWAGPTSFAVNSAGDIAIIDMVNKRVEIFSPDGKLRHLLSFQYPISWVNDIDVDHSGRWFLLVDSTEKGSPQGHGVWEYSGDATPKKKIDVASLGIQSPLNLELGQKNDLLVQDNHGFVTYRLDLTGQILSKKEDDERLYYLASQGLYTVTRASGAIQVHSNGGNTIGQYPDPFDTFSVLGLSPSGDIIMIMKIQETTYTLEGLSQSSEKRFSVIFRDSSLFQRLALTRLAGLRNVRVGPDGSVYAMGKPDDSRFRIFRYQIQP